MHNNQRIGFNNIIHMIGGLPQGHEKPLKHALYNAVALFLLFLCCAVGYALYLILDPFFKPLLWALLVGSLLHPIKYSISKRMTCWFAKLEKSNTPLIVGVMGIPVNFFNDVSKLIGKAITQYYKIAAGCIASILGILCLINFFPWKLFLFIWRYFSFITSTLLVVCNTYTFFTLMLCYLVSVYLMWSRQREPLFRQLSLLVWLCTSSYLSHLTGSLQAFTFVCLQLLAAVGFSIEVYEIHQTMNAIGRSISFVEAIKWTFLNTQYSEDFNESLAPKTQTETTDDEPLETVKSDEASPKIRELNSERDESFPLRSRAAFQTRTLSSLPLTSPETRSAFESQIIAALQRKTLKKEASQDDSSQESESSLYFKFLLWACGAMVLWKQMWLWPLVLMVITIYIVKSVGMFFGVWEFAEKHLCDAASKVNQWFSVRYSALVPAHVQGIVKIVSKSNSWLHQLAKDSIDSVSSILVICGLIFFLTFSPIFMGVQIYSEGITVVQLTSSLINRTVVHNPELRQLLPPGWDDTVDSLMDNAYVYGREGLSKAIKGVLQDSDAEKSAKLEKQLLELWDRVYQTWMSSEEVVGPQVNAAAIQQSWKEFMDDITKTPGMFNTSGLVNFAKQNVGTLMALLDSLWSLLKGNITLVLGSMSAVTSIVMGGSSAVFNFILGLVVFFTTLFYLLNSSSSLYRPIELMSQFSPSTGSRFGLALTDAVNGVFKATLKMAAFYGLWTWLIHNLFGAQIVYLPSALAAMLAAVPFLGTYFACVPAVLDLWLAQDQPLLAVLLAVCQFAPASYVDAVIYNEIKNGGHPYFTGLAIAGGIFCLGAEGAIFGPLLLCCLLVALNLSSNLFKETPLEEHIAGNSIQARVA